MMQKNTQSFLARLIAPQARQMSTAASIQARFEKAYTERAANMAKSPPKMYVPLLLLILLNK